jgi:hypothetical protein
MWVKRLIAIGAFVSLGACATAPEVAETEAVPLPRSRPKALGSPAPAPAELKPRREEFAAFQERMDRNSELARRWTLCKLLHADGLARNTQQPTETIVASAFAACTNEEDALTKSIADMRMRPAVTQEILTRIRAADREQVVARILSRRQGRPDKRPE